MKRLSVLLTFCFLFFGCRDKAKRVLIDDSREGTQNAVQELEVTPKTAAVIPHTTPTESQLQYLARVANSFRVVVEEVDPDHSVTRLSERSMVMEIDYINQLVNVVGPKDERVWVFSTYDWSSPFVLWFENAPDYIVDLKDGGHDAHPVEGLSGDSLITAQPFVRFFNRSPKGTVDCFVFGKDAQYLDDPGAPGGWIVTSAKTAPPKSGDPKVYWTRDGELEVHEFKIRTEIYFRDQLAFAFADHSDAGDKGIWNHRMFEVDSVNYIAVQYSTIDGYEFYVSQHDASGARIGPPVQKRFTIGTQAPIHCWTGLDDHPAVVLQPNGHMKLGFGDFDGTLLVYEEDGSATHAKSQEGDRYQAYRQKGDKVIAVTVCEYFEGTRDCFPESE